MDAVLPVGVALLPVVLAGVGSDIQGGRAALWLQKPVRPVFFYLGRFLETGLASLAITMLFAAGLCGVGLAMGWAPESHPLQAVPVMVLYVLVVSSVGFAASAWLPLGPRLAVAALGILTLSHEVLVFIEPQSLDNLLSGSLRVVLLPAKDLAAVYSFAQGEANQGEANSLVGPLARILARGRQRALRPARLISGA